VTAQVDRSCLKAEEGVTAIEFGLVAPVIVLFLIGFLDLGYWTYVRSTIAGALENTARSAGVGGANVDTAALQAAVEGQVRNVAPQATFVWDPRSYYQFSGIGKPEKLITDNDGDGKYDPGDCWEDLNPNGIYDQDPGRQGVGGADDILYYKVTVSFPPLIDIGGFVPGLGGNHSSVLTTIVRRQPYAAQTTPAIRC